MDPEPEKHPLLRLDVTCVLLGGVQGPLVPKRRKRGWGAVQS